MGKGGEADQVLGRAEAALGEVHGRDQGPLEEGSCLARHPGDEEDAACAYDAAACITAAAAAGSSAGSAASPIAARWSHPSGPEAPPPRRSQPRDPGSQRSRSNPPFRPTIEDGVADLTQAISMVSFYASSSEPAQVRGKIFYIQYSNIQKITNNKSSGDVAGNVLLVLKQEMSSMDVIHLGKEPTTQLLSTFSLPQQGKEPTTHLLSTFSLPKQVA
ncbi:hypothetical protein Taro_051164 [Colocasia esculenta]|uniref:Uncharacterized protein n=1 Tax=Colocasia esculenta TaxID=4460 RepID=A0A843XG48_COLES|nr:hypothetical protein [Colocasia esculenta]